MISGVVLTVLKISCSKDLFFFQTTNITVEYRKPFLFTGFQSRSLRLEPALLHRLHLSASASGSFPVFGSSH